MLLSRKKIIWFPGQHNVTYCCIAASRDSCRQLLAETAQQLREETKIGIAHPWRCMQ